MRVLVCCIELENSNQTHNTIYTILLIHWKKSQFSEDKQSDVEIVMLWMYCRSLI